MSEADRDYYKCYECQEMKPRSEFWKDRSQSRQLNLYCKPCSIKRYKRNQYPRLKASKTYQDQHRIYTKRYRQNHPEIAAAHRQAQTHRATIKKNACEHCAASDVTLHMHHPDYSKPLEVITLCRSCHEDLHHRSESL